MKPSAVVMNHKVPPLFVTAIALISFSLSHVASAASATWLENPPSGDWNSASNWTPMTVPNGPNDTATFSTTNQTNVSLSANTEVNGIVFAQGASQYTIRNDSNFTLTISGMGIINNSGGSQFVRISNPQNGSGGVAFTNAATAGDQIAFLTDHGPITFSDSARAGGASFYGLPGSSGLSFLGSSTADNGTFTIYSNLSFSGSSTAASATFTVYGGYGGSVSFSDSSTAGSATFNSLSSTLSFSNSSTAGSAAVTLSNSAQAVFMGNSSARSALFTINGSSSGLPGSRLGFSNNSTADSSTLIANGGTSNGRAGATVFSDNSAAMNATLIANTGPTISVAGNITFSGNATGDLAHVKVFGNGNLNISAHNPPGVAVGSIEGDGNVFLGFNVLTVGANNLGTTFSGHIQASGAVTKIGSGTLVLADVNPYTGGISIDGGTLRASHNGALGSAAQNGTLVSVGSAGTLTLDSGATNDYIANRASLSIVTGSIVNLNFSGAPDRLRSLLVDGVTQPPGLYGANQLPQLTGSGTILATTKAVSRKVQGDAGAFDIDLPLAGASGVECRYGDANGDYQIVVIFANNVTFSFAAVVLGAGSVASASGSGTSEVTVNLTGVSNAQIISVGLFDLNDGTETTNLVIPMGILIGDVDGNRVVNASDVVRAKLQVGQPVTGSNFRTDVIPNGVINASDVFQVKFRLGTSLP